MKVCTETGCPTLVPTSGRCAEHRRHVERTRGSRQERGYDAAHDALRREWSALVKTGNVRCWRCTELIVPDEAWDLGHDDLDRAITRGPEHAGRCNRAAGGRAAHR